MADRTVVDTNILARALLGDHPEQTARAQAILRDPPTGMKLAIVPSTLSEFIWVVTGPRLAVSRTTVVGALQEILEFPVEVVDKAVVARAVELFSNADNAWNDCLLSAYALEYGDGRVLSFDRGLTRMPGLTRIEP